MKCTRRQAYTHTHGSQPVGRCEVHCVTVAEDAISIPRTMGAHTHAHTVRWAHHARAEADASAQLTHTHTQRVNMRTCTGGALHLNVPQRSSQGCSGEYVCSLGVCARACNASLRKVFQGVRDDRSTKSTPHPELSAVVEWRYLRQQWSPPPPFLRACTATESVDKPSRRCKI